MQFAIAIGIGLLFAKHDRNGNGESTTNEVILSEEGRVLLLHTTCPVVCIDCFAKNEDEGLLLEKILRRRRGDEMRRAEYIVNT